MRASTVPQDDVPFRDPQTGILAQLLQHRDDVMPDHTRERTWQWARPQVEGAGPCARGGHSATLVHHSKASAKIVLFGGHYDAGQSSEGFTFLNDVHILDIDENKWFQPRARGTPPEPRYGHSAALVGSRVVYFGGKGKEAALRDLHALDSTSFTWYQGPASGGAPSARHGHTATLHGTRLFVFGGACGMKYYGDLYCLDLASMAWSSPTTQGPRPSSRFGHAALLVGDSLVIHGGFAMDSVDIAAKDNSGHLLRDCYKNDIRVLDIGRMLWSRLRTHGTPPVGRFGHTLVLSEDDAVLLGGWSGSRSEQHGVQFSLRDKVKGGQTQADVTQAKEDTVDYCMTLRTSDMRWVKNRYSGIPVTRRYGHTCTAIGPHLIVIGGWDGGKPLADVIVLRDRTVNEKAEENPLYDPEERDITAGEVEAAFAPDDEEDDEEEFMLETG